MASHSTTNALAAVQAAPRRGRTQQQKAQRKVNEPRALARVDGVMSASRVLPGASPYQGNWQMHPSMIYRCSICRRWFKKKDHVKSHMPTCVKRNGNPSGACWDDAWTGRVAAQVAPAIAPPVVALPAIAPPVVALPAVAPPVVALPAVPPLTAVQEDEEEGEVEEEGEDLDEDMEDDEGEGNDEAGAASTQAQQAFQSGPQTNTPTTQPQPPTDETLAPYDPNMRMDTLTTRDLITLMRARKRLIKDAGQRVDDYQLTAVMMELDQRRVVNRIVNSADRGWILVGDLQTLDMDYRRA